MSCFLHFDILTVQNFSCVEFCIIREQKMRALDDSIIVTCSGCVFRQSAKGGQPYPRTLATRSQSTNRVCLKFSPHLVVKNSEYKFGHQPHVFVVRDDMRFARLWCRVRVVMSNSTLQKIFLSNLPKGKRQIALLANKQCKFLFFNCEHPAASPVVNLYPHHQHAQLPYPILIW